jgi:hypothetical protein
MEHRVLHCTCRLKYPRKGNSGEEETIMLARKITGRWMVLSSLAVGMLSLSVAPEASAAGFDTKDVENAQRSLTDKGFDPGKIDGLMGPRTRGAIRDFQESEELPVTGRLDTKTAGKLGIGPKSIGGNFKGAGQEVGSGSKEAAHEMTEGKPLAAGKEFGKGIGRAAEKAGKGVRGAVSTDSDRADREKNPKP